MNVSRRAFLGTAAGAGLGLASRASAAGGQPQTPLSMDELARIAAEPVLSDEVLRPLDRPLRIASMELLRSGRVFLVRVRTSDGAEGLAVPNASRLADVYPVFLNRVAPFFVGKDARELEPLLIELYRDGSNYKFQGLAFWVCQAAAEFAILDLLGRLTSKSIGELLGGVRRRDIAIYRASGNRGNTPEAEIESLQQLVAETGARALKFRVGGRMSRNADSLPGRSETLIPLARETFGDEMTLYTDSNSSYDVEHALRIGRLMEEHGYGFFEEPCPFDHLLETKAVADALTIPVAGGEQEFSEWRFRWVIAHRGLDIVQPDLHYYGGYLRAMRVARLANRCGLPCTLHMSGSGLGYLDVLHFASCIEDPGPYQEFKGESNVPFECATSDLKCRDGIVRVPAGPGFGIEIDPAFVRQAERVTTG